MPCRVSPPPSSTVIVEWRRDGIPLSTHRSVETHTHTQHNFTFCHCLWLFLPLTFSSGITSSPTAPCWSALSLSQTLVGSCAWLLVSSREITATFTCLSQVMQQHLYEILSWVYSHTLTVQEFLNQSLYNVTKRIRMSVWSLEKQPQCHHLYNGVSQVMLPFNFYTWYVNVSLCDWTWRVSHRGIVSADSYLAAQRRTFPSVRSSRSLHTLKCFFL